MICVYKERDICGRWMTFLHGSMTQVTMNFNLKENMLFGLIINFIQFMPKLYLHPCLPSVTYKLPEKDELNICVRVI